jgi:hypothetical protein
MSQEDLQAALDHVKEDVQSLLSIHVAASQSVLEDTSTSHQQVVLVAARQ